MVLADFGVAFVIVVGVAVVIAVIARSQYQRRHPPLTTEQKIARAEKDLADINKQIGEADKWDT